MSKQGSNHGFPEVDEEDDALDLPSREEEHWEDLEWGLVDPSWFDFIGEDKDLEEEDDEADWGYCPGDEYYFDWDEV